MAWESEGGSGGGMDGEREREEQVLQLSAQQVPFENLDQGVQSLLEALMMEHF